MPKTCVRPHLPVLPVLIAIATLSLAACGGAPAKSPASSWTYEGKTLSLGVLEAMRRGREEDLSGKNLDTWLGYFGFRTAGVSVKARYLDPEGQRLFLLGLTPARPKARVLVIHGYLSHGGHMVELANFLLGRGFAVELLDLPGHGLSGGNRVAIDSFASYGSAVSSAFAALPADGLPRYALGHSTGAASLYVYLLGHGGGEFAGIVFAAPLFRIARQEFYGAANSLIGTESIPLPRFPFAPRGTIRNPAYLAFTQDSDPLYSGLYAPSWLLAVEAWTASFAAPAPIPSAPPLLIVQGDEDNVVDWRFNLPWYSEVFPDSRAVMYPEYSHTLLNEIPVELEPVLAEIGLFLESRLSG